MLRVEDKYCNTLVVSTIQCRVFNWFWNFHFKILFSIYIYIIKFFNYYFIVYGCKTLFTHFNLRFLKTRKNLCRISSWTTINFPSLLLAKFVLDYVLLLNFVLIKARWSDVNNFCWFKTWILQGCFWMFNERWKTKSCIKIHLLLSSRKSQVKKEKLHYILF